MKRKRKVDQGQISIEDISLSIGDKIYRNSVLYAEVVDISDALYFLKKEHKQVDIPDPYKKEILVEKILEGEYTIDKVKYQ